MTTLNMKWQKGLSMRLFSTLIVAATVFGMGAAASNAQAAVVSAIPAGNYVLDAHHASLIIKLRHQGFSHYTFRFTGLAARFGYDPAKPKATALSVTVDTRSIDTATGSDSFGKAFDAELLGADWLDAQRFPTITFASTAINPGDGQTGTITGNLTLHGVTKPVTLDVVFNGSGKSMPIGEIKAGFSATGSIKRSDFGVAKFLPSVGDDLQLQIEAEFVKQ